MATQRSQDGITSHCRHIFWANPGRTILISHQYILDFTLSKKVLQITVLKKKAETFDNFFNFHLISLFKKRVHEFLENVRCLRT